ncbi:MAG: erythromycin esterase family protein [Hyphomonadaceae bacterium]|nr:erythromycin esterase family protein [Hyphomonadaceae bacterium]
MAEPLGRYIARQTRPLPPLAELPAAPEALAPLAQMIAGAQIMALGESFHHTHEQLALRDQIVRYLVAQHGFNLILLEVITPGPNPIDTFVQGGDGSAEEALIEAGARMWRNRETAALIHWLRAHNAQVQGGAVSVRGIDVMAIGPLMRAVAGHSRTDDGARIAALSAGFNIDGRADQAAYNKLDATDRALLKRFFAEAHITLVERAELAEQARAVLRALEMLEAGTQGWLAGFALRDEAMAEAAMHAVNAAGVDAKAIILSHNTHIAAMAPITEPSHAPMGWSLRQRYGSAYFALGMAFGRAQFDPPIYGVSAFPGEAGTADHHIAELGHGAAWVDLRSADPKQILRMQGVGVGPHAYTEYHNLSAFDALVYVDTLTNAQQLVETELTMDVKAVDATRS